MQDRHGTDGADSDFWGGDDTPTTQLRRIGRDVTSQIRRVVPDRRVREQTAPSGRVRQHRSGAGAPGPDRTGGHPRPAPADRDRTGSVRRNADATPLMIDPYDFDLEDQG